MSLAGAGQILMTREPFEVQGLRSRRSWLWKEYESDAPVAHAYWLPPESAPPPALRDYR